MPDVLDDILDEDRTGADRAGIASLYMTRGSILFFDKHRYEDAIQAFGKALRLDASEAARAYYMRGMAYYLLGNMDSALSEMNAALQNSPPLDNGLLAEAYYNRGIIYLNLSGPKQAEPDMILAAKLGDALAAEFLRDRIREQTQSPDTKDKSICWC